RVQTALNLASCGAPNSWAVGFPPHMGRRRPLSRPELAAVCSLPYRLAHVMPARIEREPVKPTSLLFSCHGEVSARRGHCGCVDLPEWVRVERFLYDERRLVRGARGSKRGTLWSQPARCRT